MKHTVGVPAAQVKTRCFPKSSAKHILEDMGGTGLSPKCVLESIPEWAAMRGNFCTVTERCQQRGRSIASHADLTAAAEGLAVPTRTADCQIKSARRLKRDIDARLAIVAGFPR
eukprot:5095232-Pyramimonas_sp.AAC.1